MRLLLVAMLLCAPAARAQQGVDWTKAEMVSVLLVDDRFVPDRLTLRHGVPYLLHLENHGSEMHEFTAPEFFDDAILLEPGMLAAEGKEIVVQPQQVADVYLFIVRPGTFRLTCADHDWDGMVGEITVE